MSGETSARLLDGGEEGVEGPGAKEGGEVREQGDAMWSPCSISSSTSVDLMVHEGDGGE